MSNQIPLDPIIPKSLIESIQDTFTVQANTPIEILQVKAMDVADSSNENSDLIAAIGMNSGKISGTVAICFPKTTFLGVVNRMLGENYTEITNENSDAASEILNILYGGARVKINKAGHDFTPAIPTVTRGKSLRIAHGDSKKVVRIDCRCEFGTLHVEVSLRNRAGSQAA